MSNNRTCKVCGRTYHYCPTCPRDDDKPAWMIRFDSSTCKQLWDILAANGNGESTDAETVQKLNQLNYKSLNIENEGIRAHISRLTGQSLPTPLSKEEIKEAITSEVNTSNPVNPMDTAPNRKIAPTQNLQQAMSAAADSMHKKKGLRFLDK